MIVILKIKFCVIFDLQDHEHLHFLIPHIVGIVEANLYVILTLFVG